MSNTLILSIETSCDETAIAILRSSKKGLEILTNQVSSQVKLHAKWGGVVPNLAAREHLKNFPKLLKMALEEAQITPSQLDAISVTSGPGLIPALLVGVNYAKTLSYLWEKPLIGIHHIEGHIYANFIETQELGVRNEDLANKKQKPNSYNLIPRTYIEFPILALVVSGGHTQLVLMKDHLQYEIIGQTVDDAVGEAFDKVARILGIGYPGGPKVAQQAANFQFPISNFQTKSNNSTSKQNYEFDEAKKLMPKKLIFPRPMLHKKNFNFSFSGLKTAVLYETKKLQEKLPVTSYELLIPEICHEFQQACIDVLVSKTIKAAEIYKPKTILLAGGVSANTELREQLGKAISKSLPTTTYHLPPINLTGDNAAMIAAAAAFRWEKMTEAQKKKALDGWKTIQPNANLKMK
ncbi:MAG: putative tRNA threonylcarbamoyladenosine biosynthesis protein Gcp [Candidatus Moranbacteria bacterium GW2011_GWC2_37_73]|nr:MAG: putative tRNA threonylcarbamoyladenosine biosynthesis protein Gcp [Parcubacteria group bacterium GW2011_GWC1_36_108]KKQ01029.1 MAG: putative tRNA threonylcarbamoyladenosine biosynthesis protein Gcp [Candidatus Moranbacteria bacterium GW2011_GWD1_36_198]KKQ02431.1 MAG: putative tRNA threonylcarbamoyladenosine biosynthesis protein Gcp [Candidatus Moranbacteria bacterium GW2011_GWD2_36_198]KKQ40323.1 MAG: putative tRNA threonylcarbamoyladenosine biosynthesis protein Gcp [Candidatus Moranbac